MIGKADARFLKLGTIPGVDQIDRQAAATDVFDA
ncbi:hypothetical protein ACVIHI_008963 [Bradyrhizobium sp. USDA 4524]|nr:hypothetical protein [Bradyrhizobium sp. USDA 4538]MCP1907108.1 hypothetical protein [Bradyrhizobium sp. USDA 4537]MCP1985583.1 hypothetical protein [Bradyrhizobium sp. USDA 4539]